MSFLNRLSSAVSAVVCLAGALATLALAAWPLTVVGVAIGLGGAFGGIEGAFKAGGQAMKWALGNTAVANSPGQSTLLKTSVNLFSKSIDFAKEAIIGNKNNGPANEVQFESPRMR